jgi:hypothetical protein
MYNPPVTYNWLNVSRYDLNGYKSIECQIPGYAEQISASESPTKKVKAETAIQPQMTATEPPDIIAEPQRGVKPERIEQQPKAMAKVLTNDMSRFISYQIRE